MSQLSLSYPRLCTSRLLLPGRGGPALKQRERALFKLAALGLRASRIRPVVDVERAKLARPPDVPDAKCAVARSGVEQELLGRRPPHSPAGMRGRNELSVGCTTRHGAAAAAVRARDGRRDRTTLRLCAP